jgi:ABC-type multidrug transport system ATPase subunit
LVLLGHNGAGKTTTISMLTGLIQNTSGTAMYEGKNIFENFDQFRGKIGVCPQFEVII